MRNVARQRVRRDDEHGHSGTQTVFIERGWRRNVIVEAPEVVPGKKYGGGIPIGTLHQGIKLLNGPVLAAASAVRRMFAGRARYEPTYCRQIAAGSVNGELGVGKYVFGPDRRVANVVDGIEGGVLIAGLAFRWSIRLPTNSRIVETI